MSGHGYTYTTLTGGADEPMSVQTDFYLDETASFLLCGSRGHKRPFLSIHHGTVGVSIGPRRDAPLTEHDVSLIRKFAENAAALLAATEQFYADQPGTTQAPGSESAA